MSLNAPSPLVLRLQKQIEGTSDDEMRGVLLAQIAWYLARTGDFDGSEKIRLELRHKFFDANSSPVSGRVSISLMILEALTLYYRELSPRARDRMLRANLLAKSFGERWLAALSSSWLAHIDFNQNRFDSMAASISSAFELMEANDIAVKCRLSLVLGDAFLYCQSRTESQRWYDVARRSANELGDHAAIGAVTYNRAALQISSLRVSDALQPASTEEVASARAELQSAINYQRIAGLRSLDHLLDDMSVGLSILEGHYVSVISMLTRSTFAGETNFSKNNSPIKVADFAYCLASVGNFEEASRCLSGIDASALEIVSADDQVVALGSIAKTFKILGDHRQANLHLAKAETALLEHRAIISEIRNLIDSFAR